MNLLNHIKYYLMKKIYYFCLALFDSAGHQFTKMTTTAKYHLLSFVCVYLDRAVCSTAGSPLCSSQPRSQRDTLHLLPPHTHTPCAVTQNLRHSSGNMVTMATRGKAHL